MNAQAQSAIIPAMDAFLGINHETDSMREYLVEMRRYMPAPHVAFLERLEGLQPSVRELVLQQQSAAGKGSGLVEAYDAAVAALAQFRARHLVYAERYIKRPAQQQQRQWRQQRASPETSQGRDEGAAVDAAAEVGTGGSDFVPYLEKHHHETKAHFVGPRWQ